MRKASLGTLFLVVFLDLVGFGIVIPILPYYAQTYGASAWALGWLMTSYSLMQFLFSPLWGRISDSIGRRPVLLISILGSCLSMLILGFAPSLIWLFIGRIFAGVSGANISTAYAYITDVTTEKDRAKGMGIIGAGFGLGFIFGPAIGGILSQYGYSAPMFAGAGLSAVNWIFTYFKLPEPESNSEIRAAHRTRRFDWKSISTSLSDPRTRFAVGIFLLVTFAVTQMEVVFALYLKARFGYNAKQAGLLLALTGLIMAAMQGGLVGKMAHKWGEIFLVLLGTLICSVALGIFASADLILVMIGALVLLAIGHGMLHPSLSSLASKGAEEDRRGATMGVFQSAGSLARVIGPPCAGWLYDALGGRSPFYCGALVLALCFALTLFRRNSLDLQAIPP